MIRSVSLTLVLVSPMIPYPALADDPARPVPEAKPAAADRAEPAPAGSRVFELRTYYTNDGKLDDLHTRFRDHTCQLLKKHGPAWEARLPKLSGVRWGKPDRGFVGSVFLENYRAFRTHAARLFDLIPLRQGDFRNMGDRGAVGVGRLGAGERAIGRKVLVGELGE